MSLRIGYINVQGFGRHKWKACHALLNQSFDYLFVAETWFVEHAAYALDRRLIACTTRPRRNLNGRSRGGIYLLGSHHARSKVDRCEVTEHSITFFRDKRAYTGVYFPPGTLPLDQLTLLLASFRSSAVVLGDINARFKDKTYQSGQPGPAERVRAFEHMMRRWSFQHLKPERATIKLTTDHCFVKSGQRTGRLRLLANAALRIPTDHVYTLALTFEIGAGPACDGSRASFDDGQIHRFRVGRMASCEKQIQRLIAAGACPFGPRDSIDEMHRRLVQRCQDVQRRTIGVAHPDTTLGRPSATATAAGHQPSSLAGSIRLYKQASQGSRENDVILPTEAARQQGVDATAENLAIFKARWTGKAPFASVPLPVDRLEGWTKKALLREIAQQEADKSCGADGIHIRFLKAVQNTPLMDWLLALYNECLFQNATPRAWNRSEIYLLTKNVSKRRDADNLRPISIVCIFRKVFERLLLLRVQTQPWASLHPAQAGFRRSYSTLSNAAVVHDLLASNARSIAVFLDLKSAFDVINHQRLDAKLKA